VQLNGPAIHMLKPRKIENLISSSQDMQLQRGLGLPLQCCEAGHRIKPVLPTKGKALDRAGFVLLKVEKTEWKGPSLLSLRKLGRLERQLELNGLDAMLKQSIASSILKGLPQILSLDASLMPTSSSLMASFKDIDDNGASPTVVELRQANSL
jgi:hypothetical protein